MAEVPADAGDALAVEETVAEGDYIKHVRMPKPLTIAVDASADDATLDRGELQALVDDVGSTEGVAFVTDPDGYEVEILERD